MTIIKSILAISFLLLIATLLIFSNKLSTLNTQPLPTPQPLNSEQVLTNFASYLNTTADLRVNDDWDWLSADGTHLPLSAQMLVLSTSGINGMGKYGTINQNDIDQVTKPFILELADKTITYFKSLGFNINNANTIKQFDEMNTIRIGFEKNNIKCVVSLAALSDPFGYYICGEIDQNQLTLQQDFKNIMDPEMSKSPNYVFRVEQVDGDFARGHQSNIIGSEWFAQKENGNWKIILQTPDQPLCSVVDKLKIPQPIYQNCYTNSTEPRFPI